MPGKMTSSFGVTYVAFGAPYLAMALVSMVSLRVTNPSVPVCIVTNVVEKAPDHLPWWRADDHWTFLNSTTGDNRHAKLRVYELSPFEQTVFLDCDTLVLDDILKLRQYLVYFDVLMKLFYSPFKKRRPLLNGQFRYSEDGHFNSGVIAFRKSAAAERFFSVWQEQFSRMAYHLDQPSLVEAWFLTEAKIFPLPFFWNSGDKWAHPTARRKIIIWHYKVRLEPYLEQAVCGAVRWFGGTELHRKETEEYLALKRIQRHYRSPGWKFRRLVTRMRGDLSRRLEKHPAKAKWRAWTGTSRDAGGLTTISEAPPHHSPPN